MLYYTYLSLGAFLMSLLGTRLMVLGFSRHLLDFPSARSNHTTPTPRGGGLAVVFTLAIFLLVAEGSFLLVAALLLLAMISLVDDWLGLPPLTRLGVQALAVLMMLPDVSAPLLNLLDFLPSWIVYILITLSWLWMINLFNFMDGIDGLAGAELMSVCFGLLVVSALTATFGDLFSLYALVGMAAGCGFLWWNWQPARIFLGDVGSVPLGFFLGYLLLGLAGEGYVAAALILPAYFVLDATLTLTLRLKRGEKVWEAHSQHWYQRAVRSGRSHSEVVKLVIGINMLLIFLAVITVIYPEINVLGVVLAYALCGVLLRFLVRGGKSAVA